MGPAPRDTGPRLWRPWRRFVLGVCAPVWLLVLSLVFFTPDLLEWTYPSTLGLAVLVGLVAGLREKKWAFLLGVLTAFAGFAIVVLVAEWLKR